MNGVPNQCFWGILSDTTLECLFDSQSLSSASWSLNSAVESSLRQPLNGQWIGALSLGVSPQALSLPQVYQHSLLTVDDQGAQVFGYYSIALISIGRGQLLITARRANCSCGCSGSVGSSSTETTSQVPSWVQGFSFWALSHPVMEDGGRVLQIVNVEDRTLLARLPPMAMLADDLMTSLFSSSSRWSSANRPCFSMELSPCSTALVLFAGPYTALVVQVSQQRADLLRLTIPSHPTELNTTAPWSSLTQETTIPSLDLQQLNLRLLRDFFASSDDYNLNSTDDITDYYTPEESAAGIHEEEWGFCPPPPTPSSSATHSNGTALVCRGQNHVNAPQQMIDPRTPRTPRKRKRPRNGNRVCRLCGANETTQWRAAGTLCNCCSLRLKRLSRRQERESRP